jgi:hypothetical protein
MQNNIIDDEESVKLINDIIENNDVNSVIHNNTPISKDSIGVTLINKEIQNYPSLGSLEVTNVSFWNLEN